mmetsp:Transcript_11126/g.30862  ORF Transcript_11126/g.30862 Transcript_11126/m.30862 type:complete len:86 (+) Transcript_11126:1108-1365(+)
MQKYLDSAQTDQPLSIKSALCTEIKGYIYVEAYKEAHVREATQGMNGLFYRITQVSRAFLSPLHSSLYAYLHAAAAVLHTLPYSA